MDEGQSIDNTNQMSTTLPSFSFKNKTMRTDGTSLLHNSKRLDQTGKEYLKSKNDQNTFDSLGSKYKIPEEDNEDFNFNASTPGQSRNLSIFGSKGLSGSHCKSQRLNHQNKVLNKLKNIDPEVISEYRVNTPVYDSSMREKITKSLTNCNNLLKTSQKIKESVQDKKRKAFNNSQKLSTGTQKKLNLNPQSDSIYKFNKNKAENKKQNYKTLAEKRKNHCKVSTKTVHKATKSHISDLKPKNKTSKILRKNRTNYSVYLNHNPSSLCSENKNVLERLHTGNEVVERTPLSCHYSSVQVTPKISQNTSSMGVPEEVKSDSKPCKELEVEKLVINYVSLPSPAEEGTSSGDKIVRNKPAVVSYNLSKVEGKKRKKEQEKKRLRLQKKADSIALNSYSKYFQISLDKNSSKVEKRAETRLKKKDPLNASLTKTSSKEKVYRNYWKNKTAKYSTSQFFSAGGAQTSRVMPNSNEKASNNYSKISPSKPKTKKKTIKGVYRDLSLKKKLSGDSFSSKLKGYHKTRKLGKGSMTSKVLDSYTRNHSKSISNQIPGFGSVQSPTFKSKPSSISTICKYNAPNPCIDQSKPVQNKFES